MLCDDSGRDCSDVAANQKKKEPRIVSKPMESRKRQGRILPYRPKGNIALLTT